MEAGLTSVTSNSENSSARGTGTETVRLVVVRASRAIAKGEEIMLAGADYRLILNPAVSRSAYRHFLTLLARMKQTKRARAQCTLWLFFALLVLMRTDHKLMFGDRFCRSNRSSQVTVTF